MTELLHVLIEAPLTARHIALLALHEGVAYEPIREAFEQQDGLRIVLNVLAIVSPTSPLDETPLQRATPQHYLIFC